MVSDNIILYDDCTLWYTVVYVTALGTCHFRGYVREPESNDVKYKIRQLILEAIVRDIIIIRWRNFIVTSHIWYISTIHYGNRLLILLL